MDIRNIAIIAHVDHGKTTLVDHLLKQSGTFRSNESVEERYMDSMDLEKERGITIAAKNASFLYKDTKVNIVDTPGHSDFGGEVERVLDMVDGALLLVDASEGPLPQTRFVLKKALEQNLKIIVCINKIDRKDARIEEVEEEIFNLFIELDATDEQADYDVVYAIAKEGIATLDPLKPEGDFQLLFDWIVNKIPAPQVDKEGPLQMLVSNIDYNDYVGQLAIGRIRQGRIHVGDDILVVEKNQQVKIRVTALFAYRESQQVQVEQMEAGDIAIVAGFKQIHIGDSLTDIERPMPLPRIEVEPPTVSVMISVNDGPFAGLEGKNVTSRKIRERLDRELKYNVSLQVQDTESAETWMLMGRGELQLSVLIETMRREGFELLVSKPHVLTKIENGEKLEPIEKVTVDVEEQYSGAVTKKLGERRGVLINIQQKGTGRTRLEFEIPSRGLIGYRSEFLTDTRGTGLISAEFLGYEKFRGEFEQRGTGAMVSDRKGKATAYALNTLEDRGSLFIRPQTEVYGGMIIGENNKGQELNVNVTKEKKLSNVRASGSDDAIRLTPVKPMDLERALEWITDEELIEVTPKNIRLRCRELDVNKRK